MFVEIRGAMMFFTGMKPDDFAESKGIARSTLHRVIKNEMQTVSVRQMISDEVINIPVKEIWRSNDLKKRLHT